MEEERRAVIFIEGLILIYGAGERSIGHLLVRAELHAYYTVQLGHRVDSLGHGCQST